MQFSVTVGRWSFPWNFIWYANIFNANDPSEILLEMNFDGLTRRGVLRKATKYINKMNNKSYIKHTTYIYDETIGELTCSCSNN